MQSRVRECLVNLLNTCGQKVGLPKSPSVSRRLSRLPFFLTTSCQSRGIKMFWHVLNNFSSIRKLKLFLKFSTELPIVRTKFYNDSGWVNFSFTLQSTELLTEVWATHRSHDTVVRQGLGQV